MIGAIVPYLTRIRRSYQSNDLVDRLNYHYTAFMIALGAVTLAASQYVGKPIQCWVPPQFTGSWEKYTESYCFIKGSYFVPDDEHPDQDFIKRDEAVIGYYQWIPLVLAFQAFCFYLPCVIWQGLNSASGINVKDVLENSAKIKKNVTTRERESQVTKAADHLQEALELQRELKAGKLCRYLRCLQAATDSPADEVRISAFVRHFLTGDGVFLLRLVQVNGGDILTGEIIAALYEKYTKRFDKEFAPESPTSSVAATLPR
ncbi:hypothetical protein WR25_13607 [Diploscapter pachys]|uniref:Innexin n=1 Tax=Diploscapter pachys TaxID=2018661 RepID=A0A2A2KNQ9_9BILA|nr:hypothetical protein WR25_13607 [Diploscapter pachys]